MDAIFKRRSIRRYRKEPVPVELIKKLLKAGMAAPSAGNEQPWHFIVVRNKETLYRLSKLSPHANMLKDAPVGIVVCGDLNAEVYKGFWVQDCSAATENLLIEATYLGLGGVWLGVYPLDERIEYVRKELGVPSHIVPFAVIPIGYPAQQLSPADRYNESKVHYERW